MITDGPDGYHDYGWGNGPNGKLQKGKSMNITWCGLHEGEKSRDVVVYLSDGPNRMSKEQLIELYCSIGKFLMENNLMLDAKTLKPIPASEILRNGVVVRKFHCLPQATLDKQIKACMSCDCEHPEGCSKGYDYWHPSEKRMKIQETDMPEQPQGQGQKEQPQIQETGEQEEKIQEGKYEKPLDVSKLSSKLGEGGMAGIKKEEVEGKVAEKAVDDKENPCEGCTLTRCAICSVPFSKRVAKEVRESVEAEKKFKRSENERKMFGVPYTGVVDFPTPKMIADYEGEYDTCFKFLDDFLSGDGSVVTMDLREVIIKLLGKEIVKLIKSHEVMPAINTIHTRIDLQDMLLSLERYWVKTRNKAQPTKNAQTKIPEKDSMEEWREGYYRGIDAVISLLRDEAVEAFEDGSDGKAKVLRDFNTALMKALSSMRKNAQKDLCTQKLRI
jgi:hypothetical protein